MKQNLTKAKAIAGIVAETFGVPMDTIMAKKKYHTNNAKALSIALIEKHSGLSHEGILKMFDLRSRGNIYAARDRAHELLKKDRKMFNKFRLAESKIVGISTPVPSQKVMITEEQALAALQASTNYRYEVFRYEKKQII